MTITPETRVDDPRVIAAGAARQLRDLTGTSHDVALIVGSGWTRATDGIGEPLLDIAVTELPGFPAPAAVGHAGRIRSLRIGDNRALIFLGRTHYYENRDVVSVAHGVRTAVAAGCRTIVLTNGCGGLRSSWPPGTPVLISDHINLTGASPLTGARFVDLTDLYSGRLRAICKKIDPSLPEGVYAQLPGPHYETPAEVRMLRALGADLVGMSTTLEAIAARECGAEVLGISLVTNLAAGLGDEPLNHDEVLDAGQQASERIGALLAAVMETI